MRHYTDQIQRNDKRIGRGFFLSNTEEKPLIEALMYLAEKNFPRDREETDGEILYNIN